MHNKNDFLLLQINDALFPIGGYSHSYGLETYIQKDIIKNADDAALYIEEKEIYSGFGEMLFTHFGVSGPLILSASSYYQTAAEKLRKKKEKQAKKAGAAAEPLENGKVKAHAYLKLDLKPCLLYTSDAADD